MTARALVALLVAMSAQAACSAPPRDAADTTSGTTPAADTATTADSARQSWTVTARGLGPLRVGATVAEARSALGADFAAPDSAPGCTHVPVTAAPGRVLAMIVDGRVARIEVKDSAIATSAGARVGDTEARIDSLYSGRVEVQPHKYTDGHYLIIRPEPAADTLRRLIFETDGRRVVEYRVGMLPQVAWVEGCS